MKVAVEPDGVQVDLRHIGGGPVKLYARIPCPPELEIRVEYAGWMRMDTVGEPLPIELSPEEPLFSLWGRALARQDSWPLTLPEGTFAQLRLGGLALEVAVDDPALAQLDQLAAALGRLLAVPSELRLLEPGERPRPARAVGPVVVHLGSGPERDRKLGSVLSLAEEFALAGP